MLAHATAIDFSDEEANPTGTRLIEARHHVARALELAPDSPETLSVAGLLAETREEAERHLSRAAAIEPWRVKSSEARTARRKGDWSGYLKLMDEAIRDATGGHRGLYRLHQIPALAFLGFEVSPQQAGPSSPRCSKPRPPPATCRSQSSARAIRNRSGARLPRPGSSREY